MKFCPPHWTRLKAEIQSHGVTDFIAGSSEEALAQAAGQLRGERETRKNYDPLMAAHWMITNRVMEAAGPGCLYLLTGDYCPLCELKKNAPASVPAEVIAVIDEEWIKGASKAAVDHIATLPLE